MLPTVVAVGLYLPSGNFPEASSKRISNAPSVISLSFPVFQLSSLGVAGTTTNLFQATKTSLGGVLVAPTVQRQQHQLEAAAAAVSLTSQLRRWFPRGLPGAVTSGAKTWRHRTHTAAGGP